MKIFAYLDSKAGSYLRPFSDSSTIQALRGFDVAVNTQDSIFARYPDDFHLMEIASFDQDTGEIISHEKPQNLGSARTVLKSPPVQNSLPFGGPDPRQIQSDRESTRYTEKSNKQ